MDLPLRSRTRSRSGLARTAEGWHVFDAFEYPCLLREASEGFARRFDREPPTASLTTGLYSHVIDQLPPLKRPFLQKIKCFVEPGDFLNQVFSAPDINGPVQTAGGPSLPPCFFERVNGREFR